MKAARNAIGTTAILGLLFGVVASSVTEEWWWIGVGFAVGLGLEAIKRRAERGS